MYCVHFGIWLTHFILCIKVPLCSSGQLTNPVLDHWLALANSSLQSPRYSTASDLWLPLENHFSVQNQNRLVINVKLQRKMGLEIQVEVIHKEPIKPSSPTPAHLKTTHLSVFDQNIPDVYVPILLFYPGNSVNDIDLRSLVSERSELLKTSLSETLTHFYPLAGQLERNDSICCNDSGAAFLVALVNCPLSKILDKPDFGMLKKLVPATMGCRETDKSYMVQVRVNFFECGGMAIAVCITHKIADASTIVNFISRWATLAFGSGKTADRVPLADYGGAASLLPPLEILPLSVEFSKENWITKRFVFDASKIAALKSKAATATLPHPTRVEAVSALIWKCAIEASKSKMGSKRPSAWIPIVNLRKLIAHPSAENFQGNFIGLFAAKAEGCKVDDDDDIQSLVPILRKGIQEFKVKYTRDIITGNDACGFFQEYVSLLGRDDVDAYSCSSWCRFPFYTVDFGWGKPLWVSHCMEFTNMTVLTDTRDGAGIEAYVNLSETDMAIFEGNMGLLAHASLNPSVN